MAQNHNTDVFNQLNDKVNLWFKLALFCEWFHWIIGVIGVTFATMAASEAIKPNYRSGFAVTSAVCMSILGFVNPQKIASGYIRAYRILEPALRSYKYSALEMEEVFELHKKAEEVLNAT